MSVSIWIVSHGRLHSFLNKRFVTRAGNKNTSPEKPRACGCLVQETVATHFSGRKGWGDLPLSEPPPWKGPWKWVRGGDGFLVVGRGANKFSNFSS